MQRSIIVSTVFVFLLIFLVGGQQSAAQRRARKPSPPPATGTAAAASTPDPQKPKPKAKLTPLSSSDGGQGSRVTITSTDALNNYSAYRSGDRFYVSIPNADAGAVRDSVRGKGFSDTKVQKRGDEVVLSFKLQPGASARVNQRFNRLDVVFTAPGDSGTPASANTQQSNAQRPSNTNAPVTTNNPTPANVNAANTSGATATTRPTPAATPTPLATNDFPLGGGLTDTVLPPTGTATPLAAPSPAVTEQIAQAQPPVTTAPVTATTGTATNAPAPGSSLGVTLLRNWPLALIALLLLAGVGLFISTRRSSATRAAASGDVSEPLVAAPAATGKTSAAKLRAATTTSTTATTKTAAALTATPPVTTSSITTPLIIAPLVKESEPARPVKTTPVAKQKPDASEKVKAAAAEQSKLADERAKAADEKLKADLKANLRATKDIAPLVPVDAERVQVETKRLLEGQSYNKMMIGSADMVSRQMVAAELLSALAGRNAERRERARTAFIEHGYFNDTAHDLHFAEAPAERASAARSLGLVGDRSATAHLIAALNDPAMEVRRTTVEAVAMLKDPAAIAPLEALREREKSTKVRVPARLIKHAIDVCTLGEEEVETPTLIAAVPPPVVVVVAAAPIIEPVQTIGLAPVEVAPPVVEAQTVDAPTVEAPTVEAERPLEETPTLEAQPVEVTAEAEPLPVTAAAEETLVATLPATQEGIVSASQAEASVLDEAMRDEASPETSSAEAATVAESAVEGLVVEESAVAEASVEEITFDGSLADESLVEALPVSASDVAEEVPAIATTDEALAVSPVIDESVFEIEEPAAVAVDEIETARVESDSKTIEPFESGAELLAASQEVAIEPAATIPAIEAQTDAGAASGDWVELDMDEAENVLQPSPAGSFTRGFGDFDGANEATSIQTFEFEKSIEHAPGAEAFAPTALEEVASEDMSFGSVSHAPRDEFVPVPLAGSVAPPAEEKAVVPAAEDYSTVPKAIQLRLASEEPGERAVGLNELSRVSVDDAFNEICAGFDDSSEEVRNAAARSLYQMREDRAESFTHALRDAPPDRRRNIGAAIASSGLADEAIVHLAGESRDKTYEAFSLLFLMAKAGEVQPLIRAIESHQDNDVRLAVVKLLALSGQSDILPAFRRLAVRGSLPPEVRTAVMEAIYQISSAQQPA